MNAQQIHSLLVEEYEASDGQPIVDVVPTEDAEDVCVASEAQVVPFNPLLPPGVKILLDRLDGEH
jgi:hypothetical protein